MVFQWFCYHWTITIECFFIDWPLTSMVFQWFSPKSDTMVNNGFGPFERPRKGSQSPHNRIFSQINLMIEKGDKWISQNMSKFPCHFADWRQNQNCFELLRPHFATIAKFQWFSKAPSPLNGMVWDNHWVQWFFDGFGVRQPLVSMVYDGCPPLVRRWNGYIPSLKSWVRCGATPLLFSPL